MHKLIFFLTAVLLYSSSIAMADICSVLASDDVDFLPVVANPENQQIDAKADHAQLVKDDTSVFTGNVELRQANRELIADRATYNKTTGYITAQGNVRIRDSDIILHSAEAEWSVTADQGDTLDASYLLRGNYARGIASTAHQQGRALTILDNATYTTCSANDSAWQLSASTVKLNHQTAVGVAHHAVLRLGGFPVFYTPYVNFPLNDERKSGFLTPSVGTSGKLGTEIITPYYWNIAPNMDATLTPRNMSKRGLMLIGEFRYLSHKSRGILGVDYLPNDDLKRDGLKINKYYNQNRKHIKWLHNTQVTPRLYTNVDYNYVSDIEYLNDFGSSLGLTSTTHIKRLFQASYNHNNWSLNGRVESYQTLADVVKPYQRSPEISFTSSLPNQFIGLTYALKARYVKFDHKTKLRGRRIDIVPAVSLPLRWAAAFVKPRAALHSTWYELNYKDGSEVKGDRMPTRALPLLSVDSGLFFERDINIWGQDYIHTLEPRAFYLYVPERDQQHIPIFDTSLRTFNMAQLFSYDRFSGNDRIGDTNQVSMAITSRIVDRKTGQENFRFSVGQIQYLKNRNVALHNSGKDTRSQSDIVAEAVLSLGKKWKIRSEMQWDPYQGLANILAAQLRYRGDNKSIFNITHRYRRDRKEQIDLSTYVPFNHKWSMVGRWYYSMKEDEHNTLESLLGIQYDSCCWAARLVGSDYYNKTDKKLDFGMFFQLELRGLGIFGQKTDELLKESILGY